LSIEDLLRRIVSALEQAGIPYMLTGSVASSYHGEGRASQDIDLVIAPDEPQLHSFLSSLPLTTYYVSEEAALDALRQRSHFNVIDKASGWKVDLIVRRDRRFSRTEFERRISVDALGTKLTIATAEDVVVSKLEWAKMGASERQLEDVAGILRDSDNTLDHGYIEQWVRELGLEVQWERASDLARRTP
jgi:hypothetical protein